MPGGCPRASCRATAPARVRRSQDWGGAARYAAHYTERRLGCPEVRDKMLRVVGADGHIIYGERLGTGGSAHQACNQGPRPTFSWLASLYSVTKRLGMMELFEHSFPDQDGVFRRGMQATSALLEGLMVNVDAVFDAV